MSGLEIVGIIANIAQLVDGTLKVIDRYNDFSDKTNNLPKTFRSISVQLPVLLNALNKIGDAIKAGSIPEDSSRGLRPLVEECLNQLTALDRIVAKALPKEGNHGFVRGYKTIASFRYEDEVQQMESVLQKYVQTLTLDRVVSSSIRNLPGKSHFPIQYIPGAHRLADM